MRDTIGILNKNLLKLTASGLILLASCFDKEFLDTCVETANSVTHTQIIICNYSKTVLLFF